MKLITIAVAALLIAITANAAPPREQAIPVRIFQGALLCQSHGDLVVFANTGSPMPSCRRLARDTDAVQVEPAESGIIPVRSGNSDKFWTLEASVRRRPATAQQQGGVTVTIGKAAPSNTRWGDETEARRFVGWDCQRAPDPALCNSTKKMLVVLLATKGTGADRIYQCASYLTQQLGTSLDDGGDVCYRIARQFDLVD